MPIQEQCLCGWKGKIYPDGTSLGAPGGEFPCPDCTMAMRNKGIEAYGRVRIVRIREVDE